MVGGGLLQLGRKLMPREAPVSSFTRPSFLIHCHRFTEQPAFLGGQSRRFFSFRPCCPQLCWLAVPWSLPLADLRGLS